MKTRYETSGTGSRSGTTLVEAIVGTAILATVLVALLLIHSRLVQQSARTQRRLEACVIADALLGRWQGDDAGPPAQGEGPVVGKAGWSWRTRVLYEKAVRDVGQVLRVEILAEGTEPGEPILGVEVLVPYREKRQ